MLTYTKIEKKRMLYVRNVVVNNRFVYQLDVRLETNVGSTHHPSNKIVCCLVRVTRKHFKQFMRINNKLPLDCINRVILQEKFFGKLYSAPESMSIHFICPNLKQMFGHLFLHLKIDNEYCSKIIA